MSSKPAVVAALVFGCLSSACVPLHLGPGAFSPQYRQPPPRLAAVGQWHVVMSLRPGVVVRVLAADGATHIGRVGHAGFDWIRLHANVTVVDIQRHDIVRVDRLDQGPNRTVRKVLGGALGGAVALAGFDTLLVAILSGAWHTPPARTWATGAAMGAVRGTIDAAVSGPWRTIYIDPRVV